MTPYAYGIAAVLVCGIAAGSYVKGRSDGAALPKAELAVLRAQTQTQQDHFAEVARRLGSEVARLNSDKAAYDTAIARLRLRPLYRSVCIDDDGLRLVNDALAGIAARTASALSEPVTP